MILNTTRHLLREYLFRYFIQFTGSIGNEIFDFFRYVHTFVVAPTNVKSQL